MTATLTRELPSDLVLLKGWHSENDSWQMCVMEAVAFVACEPWSDRPQCACPVISAFLRTWNDSITDDATRTKLLAPLVPRLVGTRSTPEVELARAMLCVDWSCREWLPSFLELAPGLKSHSEAIRAAKPIQEWTDFDAVVPLIGAAQKDADAAWAAARDAARDAAWAAARDAALAAARDAAWAAAWAAARDAARDAAWDAAWAAALAAALAAARDAAWDAAWAAAWDAALAAAWDAARDALKPTTDRLQQSAVALVERLITVK